MEAGENQKQVSTGSHTPLGIPRTREIPTFPPRRLRFLPVLKTKSKAKPKTKAAA